jgi:hypothetical protein
MSQKSQFILTQGRCWLIVVCILWLCGCATVEWSNQQQDTPYIGFAKHYFAAGTNCVMTAELGFRSDGVVVWRESK